MNYSNVCKELCLICYGDRISIDLTMTQDYEFLEMLPNRQIKRFDLASFLKQQDQSASTNAEHLRCILNTIPNAHFRLYCNSLDSYDEYAYCADENNNLFIPSQKYALSAYNSIKISANCIKYIILLFQSALKNEKFIENVKSKTKLRIPNIKKYLFNTLNVLLMLHPLTYTIFNNKCITNTLTTKHIKTYGFDFPEESVKQNGVPLNLEQFQNQPITEELINNLIQYVTKIIKLNSK